MEYDYAYFQAIQKNEGNYKDLIENHKTLKEEVRGLMQAKLETSKVSQLKFTNHGRDSSLEDISQENLESKKCKLQNKFDGSFL